MQSKTIEEMGGESIILVTGDDGDAAALITLPPGMHGYAYGTDKSLREHRGGDRYVIFRVREGAVFMEPCGDATDLLCSLCDLRDQYRDARGQYLVPVMIAMGGVITATEALIDFTREGGTDAPETDPGLETPDAADPS